MAIRAEPGATSSGFPRNRGVAVYDGMVFIAMINGHLAALDAKTGKVTWNKQTVKMRRRLITRCAGPL